MPGPILHLGAVVTCYHGGMAEPLDIVPTVLVSGMPVATLASVYLIAGCAFPPPPVANGPCVVGEWVLGATRVFAEGLPVLTEVGVAVCELSGTGLLPEVVQPLVIAE
jgi:hypothetical protein